MSQEFEHDHDVGRLVLPRRRIAPSTPTSSGTGTIKVSLTSFLDYFVAASPTGRQGVAKRTAQQLMNKYKNYEDLYAPLRRSIMSSGGEEIGIDLTDAPPNRLKHYPSLIRGWNAYVRKNNYETTRVKQRIWTHEGLAVRVNPEIALFKNNQINYVKLYLKTDSPGHHRLDAIHQLMFEMLVEDADEQVSVLNVRKGRLVTPPKVLPDPRLAYFLRLDAVSFHRAIGYFLH